VYQRAVRNTSLFFVLDKSGLYRELKRHRILPVTTPLLQQITVHYYSRRCRPAAEILGLCFAPGNVETELRRLLIYGWERSGIYHVGMNIVPDLDAYLAVGVIHDKVHCSAEQSGSEDARLK